MTTMKSFQAQPQATRSVGYEKEKNSQHSVVKPNGEINKLLPEDRIGHDWYRFVLSFPPHLVRYFLKRFDLDPGCYLLDPFCGTGTTLVEAKLRNIRSVGVERNPMAHFASEVKLDWSPDPVQLLAHAQDIADDALKELRSQGINDKNCLGFDEQPGLNLTGLAEEKMKLIQKNSISPLPLHKSLVLLSQIEKHYDARYQKHEKLALAKAISTNVSNLRFGPEVGLGQIKPDAQVVSSWLKEVTDISSDLSHLTAHAGTPSYVYRGDARSISNFICPKSVDGVITSPPYPNEKDYTRTTRLESVLLGFIQTKSDLRSLKQDLVRSNTRGVYKGDRDGEWIDSHPDIQHIANEIEQRRIQLGKTSGFEKLYATVTKLYFGGMARHLADLTKVLRPGAKLAYVVGDQASYLRVLIRTGELLADIGFSLGYEVLGIDLLRTRLATATKEHLREEIVLLRWAGKCATPKSFSFVKRPPLKLHQRSELELI